MELTWVNHASFVCEQSGIRLLCDPWLEGTAFNDGWALLAPSRFPYHRFDRITHIWFSHEHPDHFSPSSLGKIDPALRARIVVLYQQTSDGKVAAFCRRLGFREVVELEPSRWHLLDSGVRVLCGKASNESDSWLCIKTPDATLLNMNDCVFPAERLRLDIRPVVGAVDVLLTQFSYANWCGNRDDVAARQRAAREKLDDMRQQIEVFRPRQVVPFASYVWFCNRDNFHMNQEANRIDAAVEEIASRTTAEPVVLYPGDVWKVGSPRDSSPALASYALDYERVADNPALIEYPVVPLEALRQSAEAFRQKALSFNDRRKLLSYEPFTFYLTDHDRSLSFSFRAGIEESARERLACDVALRSQPMKFCFDNLWGFGTLMVSGVFEKPPGGRFRRLEEYEWIATLNNRGQRMPGLARRALNRLRSWR